MLKRVNPKLNDVDWALKKIVPTQKIIIIIVPTLQERKRAKAVEHEDQINL